MATEGGGEPSRITVTQWEDVQKGLWLPETGIQKVETAEIYLLSIFYVIV